uniref:Nuclear cap-binding protein subunit 2 n=1 Tax=Henneguya salminicola TaxID=69463 RepID=A0A6G3MKY9_HENSL
MIRSQKRRYKDRNFPGTQEEFEEKLKISTTLYVGNLSFYTEETQVYELFSFIGPVKNVIMGLNRFDKTPCGFCFVEYYDRHHAEMSVNNLNGTVFDGRILSIDIDAGFIEGRQYGRGRQGGQIMDEKKTVYDEERGGYTKFAKSN